jgi:thioredoxin-like negative regulator of GroEL
MFTPEASYEAVCRIADLVAEDRYSEARPLIDAMAEIEDVVPLVIFYKAICIYEDKDDVECVRLLSRFIERAPRNKKAPYARFTIAICLINLGAYAEALELFATVPPDYPDWEKEVAAAKRRLEIQRQAIAFCSGLRGVTT